LGYPQESDSKYPYVVAVNESSPLEKPSYNQFDIKRNEINLRKQPDSMLIDLGPTSNTQDDLTRQKSEESD
jgi:hypothetical protein